MTADDMMTLRALLEQSSDAGLLRETIGFTTGRPIALEVEGLAGRDWDFYPILGFDNAPAFESVRSRWNATLSSALRPWSAAWTNLPGHGELPAVRE